MKTPTFPVEIKNGSVTVKIYQIDGPHRTRYTASFHEGGIRRLRQFANLGKAKKEAKVIAEKLSSGEGLSLNLTGKDRVAYLFAVSKLKPLGLDLVPAVEQFVAAHATGAPMVEACQYWAKQHMTSLPVKKVDEVHSELLAAKKEDGCSERYIGDLKSRLGRFADDFRMPIAEVATGDIDNWLRGLKLSARTRNNYRNVIETMFAFAKSRGYLSRESTTAAEHASVARSNRGEIQIFSPCDFGKLLAAADDVALVFFAFGGLCGLRTQEILRLRWEAVNWAESVIQIGASVSKTRVRRLAPLTSAAAKWLAGYKQKATGLVIPVKGSHDYHVQKACDAAKVEWKRNALRHSYISYAMAKTRDAIRVAHDCGNSPQIIRSNYDRVVTFSQGKAWFSIMPETAANVIQMKGAA